MSELGRAAGRLRRPWDGYDAYLFDIDGTLLNCTDATHYFAFCDVLSSVAGKALNLDGVIAHGNTDVGILRDAFARSGVPEDQWRPRLDQMRATMGAFVAAREQDLCITTLPGAERVLGHLRERGAVLGVATGNLERIGRLKLERCGLWKFFDFGGWSDRFGYRADVFGAALKQARGLLDGEGDVCVFGDTPADVQAAKANGLDVIAVATGIYTREQLAAEEPGMLLDSLEELFAGDAADR